MVVCVCVCVCVCVVLVKATEGNSACNFQAKFYIEFQDLHLSS